MKTRADFPTRLALARRVIAHGLPPLDVHLADQLDAASREARQFHDQVGAVLPILEPGRNWRERVEWSPSDTVRAYLLAALLGCVNVCPHLRKGGGPQPAIANLGLARVDCRRCVQTVRRPVTAEDQCDFCLEVGVTLFFPSASRMGPTLVIGHACPDCAGTLGISQTEAVS